MAINSPIVHSGNYFFSYMGHDIPGMSLPSDGDQYCLFSDGPGMILNDLSSTLSKERSLSKERTVKEKQKNGVDIVKRTT